MLPAPDARVDVFVVDLVGEPSDAALRRSPSCASAGLAADRAYGGRSVKKQMARGRASRARRGPSSSARRKPSGALVAVKDLRRGEQLEVRRDEVAAWLSTRKDDDSPMMRTHRAGDRARRATSATSVVVCGWVAHRRDHGGKVFLDVRDVAGIVQVVVDPVAAGLEVAHRLRDEWVVRVDGTVCGPAAKER